MGIFKIDGGQVYNKTVLIVRGSQNCRKDDILCCLPFTLKLLSMKKAGGKIIFIRAVGVELNDLTENASIPIFRKRNHGRNDKP